MDNLIPYGWLKDYREAHDIPPYDITLTGLNFKSRNPFNPLEIIEMGAFLPIGTKSSKGQVIKGELKSSGVIYRCNPDGSELEVHAWGIRDPYALAHSPLTGACSRYLRAGIGAGPSDRVAGCSL